MNLLIIGCGSIGRRHARNAKILGLNVILCDVDEQRMHEFGKSIDVLNYYTDYVEAAKSSGCDAAIIATPSNLHIEPAKILIKYGIHVLMEKPLCTSLDSANELKPLVEKSKIIFMMAHTYRFRSEWIEMKILLDKKSLGTIYSAEFMGGLFLPDWHIHEDYRQEYAAQKILGGGVLLTSLSHIFDLIGWFFGDIKKVTGAKMQLSKLELNVDDAVMCTILTTSGIAVSLSEDFLNRSPRRTIRINAEHGYMEADFNRKTLSVWDARDKRFLPSSKEFDSKNNNCFKVLEDGVLYDLDPDISQLEYSGNDAYMSELEYFMDLVSLKRSQFDLGIDSGINVLQALNHVGIENWIE